jgi:hypothetical protein
MAQQQFNPVPDVTTHADARSILNSNFTDSENRLASLEASLSVVNSLQLQYTQQTLTSSSGSVILDVANGYNGEIILTEDTNLTITGATAGSGGVIIVKQDLTGGWNMTSTYVRLSGILANIIDLTVNEIGVCSVSWYFNGSDYFLFVSDVN